MKMGYNGKDSSPYEPDWDAYWHAHTDDLPTGARCETCLAWAGLCMCAHNRVTMPEDRCAAWRPHPCYLEHVAQAQAAWRPKDGDTEKTKRKREWSRRLRIECHAAR